jgi:hypothetical protein
MYHTRRCWRAPAEEREEPSVEQKKKSSKKFRKTWNRVTGLSEVYRCSNGRGTSYIQIFNETFIMNSNYPSVLRQSGGVFVLGTYGVLRTSSIRHWGGCHPCKRRPTPAEIGSRPTIPATGSRANNTPTPSHPFIITVLQLPTCIPSSYHFRSPTRLRFVFIFLYNQFLIHWSMRVPHLFSTKSPHEINLRLQTIGPCVTRHHFLFHQDA